MPTRRRKILPYRIGGRLNDGQRSLLLTGCPFFAVPGEPLFESADEERAAWQRHRAELMADREFNVCSPGRRPWGFWRFDCNLKPTGWPQEWAWPRGIESEAHMVHRLPDTSAAERAAIEAHWLTLIRQSAGNGGEYHACRWGGCPKAFYRKHSPPIIAEHERKAAAFRASLMGQTGNGAVAE